MIRWSASLGLRLLAGLLLVGAVAVLLLGRARPPEPDFGLAERFTPERIEAVLVRKLELDDGQRLQLRGALERRAPELAALRNEAAGMEPEMAAFRDRVRTFLDAEQEAKLLHLMQERRKAWRKAGRDRGAVADCAPRADTAVTGPDSGTDSVSSRSGAGVPVRVRKAMAELTPALGLDGPAEAALTVALQDLYTAFAEIRRRLHPRFWALMDEVYAEVGDGFSESQREALAALRVRRAGRACTETGAHDR